MFNRKKKEMPRDLQVAIERSEQGRAETHAELTEAMTESELAEEALMIKEECQWWYDNLEYTEDEGDTGKLNELVMMGVKTRTNAGEIDECMCHKEPPMCTDFEKYYGRDQRDGKLHSVTAPIYGMGMDPEYDTETLVPLGTADILMKQRGNNSGLVVGCEQNPMMQHWAVMPMTAEDGATVYVAMRPANMGRIQKYKNRPPALDE